MRRAGGRRAFYTSLPPAPIHHPCSAGPAWIHLQKDYSRHEESGLEGYLHDMLTYIQ